MVLLIIVSLHHLIYVRILWSSDLALVVILKLRIRLNLTLVLISSGRVLIHTRSNLLEALHVRIGLNVLVLGLSILHHVLLYFRLRLGNWGQSNTVLHI